MKKIKTIILGVIIISSGCKSLTNCSFNYESPQSVIDQAKQYIKNNDIRFREYTKRIPLETLAVDSVEYHRFYKDGATVRFIFKDYCKKGSNMILGKQVHYLNFSYLEITVFPDGNCKQLNSQYSPGAIYMHDTEYDLDFIEKDLRPEIENDLIIKENEF